VRLAFFPNFHLLCADTNKVFSDGHYGLWLDDNLEKGVSNKCLTFGNEPLSDEGVKFDILGVELWYIG
jgi:hypothetical protein